MKTRQVAVGDSFMNVAVEGSGHPILFVHGFPLDHSMWRYQFEEFAKRHLVICPDLPGFGSSPASHTPMTMQSLAHQIAALLGALTVNKPVVFCGLSMGGYVGWQFWRHHANRLSHLVACDTRAANDLPEVARGRKLAALNVRKTGTRPVADAMVEKLFYRPDHPEKKSVAESVHQVILQTDPESIARGQLAMAIRPDTTTWLKQIEIPMLWVVGAHDTITPPDEMRANADLVAGSEFLKISRAGHLAPLENPGEFNRGLAAFLD